jgi:ribonuclease P protein component
MNTHETHLPTEQDQEAEGLRFPQKNGRCKGAPSHQPQAQTRTQTPDNCIKRTFPKSVRILCHKQFQRIMRTGTKLPGSHLVIHYHVQHAKRPRLGITVSKKHGKAHERNRFKRVIREAFRSCQHELPRGIDINVMPMSKTRDNIDPSTIVKDFLLLTKGAKTKDHL